MGSITDVSELGIDSGLKYNSSTKVLSAPTGYIAIGQTSATGARLDIMTPATTTLAAQRYRMTAMAHGMTSILPTDCYAQFDVSTHAAGYSEGGLQITGIGAAGGCSTSLSAVTINGYHGVTDPTDTDPAIKLVAGKKSGAGVDALAAAETAFSVFNTSSSLLTLRGDGMMGLGIVNPDVAGVFSICSTVSGASSSPGYEPSNATIVKHSASFINLNCTNYSSAAVVGGLLYTMSHASQTEKILGAITTEMNGGDFPYQGLMKFYVQGAGSLLIEALRLREVGELVCNFGIDVEKGFVANENGEDYDFRVEGDTTTHALFVQGSNDCVGIWCETPEYPLDVMSAIRISNLSTAVLHMRGFTNSDEEQTSCAINMKASRGATIGSLVETQNGDTFGSINLYGVNSTSAESLSAVIMIQQSGAAGATYVASSFIVQLATDAAAPAAALILTIAGITITGTCKASGYISADDYAGISDTTGTGQEKATIGTLDAAKNVMYFYDASGGTYTMQFKNGLITYLTYTEPA